MPTGVPSIGECLNYLAADTLRRIAQNLDYRGDISGKAELIRELPRLIVNQNLPHRLQQLSPEAAQRLWLEVISIIPCNPEIILNDEPEAHISDELQSKGILLPLPSGAREGRLVIPSELRPVYIELFTKHFLPRMLKPVLPSPTKTDRGEKFYRNFLSLASLCARKRLRITGQGRIFKRMRHELGDLLDTVGEKSQMLTIDEELFWLEQLGNYTGIIMPVGETLKTTRAIVKWLQEGSRERVLEFMRIGADSGPLALALPLATRLLKLSGDEWLRYSPSVNLYNVLPGAENLEFAWRFLHLAGILEVGEELNNFHVTALGKSILDTTAVYQPNYENHLVIQADFTIIAPKDMDLAERWQLERIADLEAQDTIYHYRLTRDSIQRALESGMERETIFTFLQERSSKPLPQSVVYTLQNWIDRYGRLRFMPAFLLIADNGELMDEVTHLPAIASNIVEQIGESICAVRRESYEDMISALIKAGYMPRAARSTTRASVWDDEKPQED